MSLIYKKMVEISVQAGALILEMGLTQREWDSYGGYAGEQRLRFVGSGKDILMTSLEELRERGPSFEFESAYELEKNPTEWASMLSSFLGLPGPLRQDSQMTSEYYLSYNIKAQDFPVRIESDGLRWYGIKPPDPSSPAMFFDMKCMSKTLRVVVEKRALKRP